MIRVLIADDHELIRAGFKQYIQECPNIVVADEAENGNEALDKALNCDYDVFLVDIGMPGMSGLDILKQLKNQKPDSKVLVVTVHP